MGKQRNKIFTLVSTHWTFPCRPLHHYANLASIVLATPRHCTNSCLRRSSPVHRVAQVVHEAPVVAALRRRRQVCQLAADALLRTDLRDHSIRAQLQLGCCAALQCCVQQYVRTTRTTWYCSTTTKGATATSHAGTCGVGTTASTITSHEAGNTSYCNQTNHQCC